MFSQPNPSGTMRLHGFHPIGGSPQVVFLLACLGWIALWVTGIQNAFWSILSGGLLITCCVACCGYERWRYLQLLESLQRVFRDLTDVERGELISIGLLQRMLPADLDLSLRSGLLGLCSAVADLSRQMHDTEHARVAAELRIRRAQHEHEQLREILLSVADPVLAVNFYHEIVFANDSALRLLGLSPQEGTIGNLQDTRLRELLIPLVGETRKRQSQAVRTATAIVTDADGRERQFRITARIPGRSGIQENDASLQNVVLTFYDTSAQRALQQRNAEFVSSVSHEMKTPLSGITAYVELLLNGDVEDHDTQQEFLGVIQSQAERLQRLVENLLNLARIEAGVVKVEKEPRSLNELLQEAHNVLAPSAALKNITFCCEPSNLYLGVFADRDMLLQAIINLGSNAVKYTPAGGKVTLVTRADDREIVLEVRDTGVGLSEEDRLKVFEKFYRVARDKNMAPGTGLGLPLVKHIVEDVHGGRIEVESQLGVGSRFRMVLPALDQIRHKGTLATSA